jgi:hypothetical protein
MWLQAGERLPNYKNTLIQNKIYYVSCISRKQKWKLFVNANSTHLTFKVSEIMHINMWYVRPVKLLDNSKYKLEIVEKISKALLGRLLKKKSNISALLWKTIKWLRLKTKFILETITRNKLKNIYYKK